MTVDRELTALIARADQELAQARVSLRALVDMTLVALDRVDGDPLRLVLAAGPVLERKSRAHLEGTLLVALLELAEARRQSKMVQPDGTDWGWQPGDLLTAREVAAMFGVDPKTVIRWARNGRLDSVRTPGGQHRFWRSDVLALRDTQGGS